MKKSNSHKEKRTALKSYKQFLSWMAVFELAVLFLCTGPLTGFVRRVR